MSKAFLLLFWSDYFLWDSFYIVARYHLCKSFFFLISFLFLLKGKKKSVYISLFIFYFPQTTTALAPKWLPDIGLLPTSTLSFRKKVNPLPFLHVKMHA